MLDFIIFAFIGVWIALEFSPKKTKTTKFEARSVVVVEPNARRKKSFWDSLLGYKAKPASKEDENAYSQYQASHSGSIKVFYYVVRYSMRKEGYTALVSAYMVKAENYYGFIQVRKFEVLEGDAVREITKVVRESFPNGEIIVTKLN